MLIRLLTYIVLLSPSIVSSQTITTIAGNGLIGNTGDGGLAILAKISYPGGGTFDKNGNYYFVTSNTGNSVRKITPEGMIYTVAGTGVAGFSGDNGPATAAQLKTTQAVAVDTSGNLYIADAGNNRIRRVSATDGIITTIAGTGVGAYGGDGGPATAAGILNPLDICFDKKGNLYIAENASARVRKVNTTGTITTIAGTGAIYNSPGGGLADTTAIIGASGLCSDDTGNLYIANWHSRVYKIDTFGIIRTHVGNGIPGFGGDGGIATAAQTIPNKVCFDNSGKLYIAEYDQHRVRMISSSGTINTVAGNGIPAFSGDGSSAVDAQVNYPGGVALDACSNLYISDTRNHRIRKVTFNPVSTPAITVTGISTATVGATVTVNAAVSGAGSAYTIKWFRNATLFSTTTLPTTTYVKGAGTDTITARVVPAVSYCFDSALSGTPHIITTSGVGIGSVQPSGSALSVYPSPVRDVLHLSCAGGVGAVVVTDHTGRAVVHAPAGTTQLPVQGLPPGLYSIQVQGLDGSTHIARFVKE